MQKKVLLLNDLSTFGRCSLTAAIAVLSAMNVQPCPLPVAVLSNQTGYGGYKMTELTGVMDDFFNRWTEMDINFDGIYTGYFSCAAQIEKAQNAAQKFKTDSSFLLVDPVLGDSSVFYDTSTKELCRGMRELVKRADIITPNLTELCFLADVDYHSLTRTAGDDNYAEKIYEITKKMLGFGKTAIVTGVRKENSIYNILVRHDEFYCEKSQWISDDYSGTGDIFSSVICSYAALGKDLKDGIKAAANFIGCAVRESAKQNTNPNDGIMFEPFLKLLMT